MEVRFRSITVMTVDVNLQPQLLVLEKLNSSLMRLNCRKGMSYVAHFTDFQLLEGAIHLLSGACREAKAQRTNACCLHKKREAF